MNEVSTTEDMLNVISYIMSITLNKLI